MLPDLGEKHKAAKELTKNEKRKVTMVRNDRE